MSAAPPSRLDPAAHPWIAAPATRRVIAALEAVRPGCARFVGGCVRNALSGRKADDIDIATQLVPDEAAKALKAARIAVHPTGIEHGTLTAVADHVPFEVTTLRRDVATDGRRATVAFTEDWAEDAARRDFRFNAIYADPDGSLFDPEGGVADAIAGRVIFIGRPQDRIAEDYLRILRFFRFFAWYGTDAPDPAGLAACAEMAEGVARLSVERVWKEMKKLLDAPDPRAATAAMAEAGVLARTLGEGLDPGRLHNLVALDAKAGFEPDAMLRFAALIGDRAEAGETARKLKLSNAERDRLKAALNPAGRFETLASLVHQPAAERAIYRLGARAFEDHARLIAAEPGGQPGWDKAVRHARAWTRPAFPLTGEDLLAAGVETGPELGETLRRLEAEWVADGFAPDKDELLGRI